MEASRFFTPIKRGEYDLVNISLLGFDPTTGKPYQECHDEWSAAREALEAEQKTLRWWEVGRHLAYRLKLAALTSHFGMY
jgi:hypothetical protein